MTKVLRRRSWLRRGGVVAVTLTVGAAMVSASAAGNEPAINPTDYVGSVEVVRDSGAEPPKTVRGVVFNDADQDSRSDGGRERGIAGVAVSNGRDVVRTDRDGRYELPVYDGMTVFVTKPAGYLTPVDSDGFPQFFYHHLPEGSPDLRFDGLPPTGPLPKAINFPLLRSPELGEMNCAVIGDTQTYSNRELGYLRDGVVADLAARDDLDACGALIAGDVVGDDLGLYPRLKQVMGLADVPVRAVPGNHDLDFDATDDANSFDTYKREIGPSYYSYDVGDVHFVGLDNVRYPCTPDDNADGKHAFCNDPANHPRYNGVIGEAQLTWLANDLATVPKDKLVVIATHIPLVGFQDMNSTQHQTDDVGKLYELLKDRPALSVAGHTQALENLDKGDSYAGWKANVGVNAVPFQHIVVGAASGSWWTGDLGVDGLPETLQRDGSPPGYLNLKVNGNRYVDTYRATGRPADEQLSLSLNSPMFQEWYTKLNEWNKQNPSGSTAPPPVNINDLGDPNLLTKADLDGGASWLVANFWNGTSRAKVAVQIDDRKPVAATRTQQAKGEGQRAGTEYGDPYALMRQLGVARYGLASTSGDDRAQGWEVFRGSKFGPGPAQPLSRWLWSDRSNHLWRLALPSDLAVGTHTATVRATDDDGREFVDSLMFEVVDERPPMQFRKETFAQPTG